MPNIESLIIIIAVIAGGIGLVLYFVNTQMKVIKESLKKEDNPVLVEWLKEMKSSVEKSSDVLEKQLSDQRSAMNQQTKLIWERLDNAADVVRNVQKQMGGIQEFGNDIKDLSNILKSPKMRGGLGEQLLYEILANILPNDLYETQYAFKRGEKCDAVVRIDDRLIPIDSKFPIDKFKDMITLEDAALREKARKTFIAAVKMRVDEIADKYIIPEEGTTDQAIMYIPSENVYYELIMNSPETELYARQRHVVMASPNTISYLLKTMFTRFQQFELQKNADQILKALSGIRVEAEKFSGDLDVLEGHISDTYKSMDKIRTKFLKLFGKIESASAIGEAEQPGLLEDPEDKVI